MHSPWKFYSAILPAEDNRKPIHFFFSEIPSILVLGKRRPLFSGWVCFFKTVLAQEHRHHGVWLVRTAKMSQLVFSVFLNSCQGSFSSVQSSSAHHRVVLNKPRRSATLWKAHQLWSWETGSEIPAQLSSGILRNCLTLPGLRFLIWKTGHCLLPGRRMVRIT